MLNLFNLNKPSLVNLLHDDFTDIHSHILPNIDDGPKNIEESIELISSMKEMGFGKIVGTPHTYPGLYDNDNKSIQSSYKYLMNISNLNIDIKYASEYFIDYSLISKAEKKSLLTIKDNYVLLEMSFISAPIDLYEIIFKIISNGYNPIIAHPERYIFFYNNPQNFKKLKNVGCFFQANLLSATGYYGKNVVKALDYLLSNNMIEFVGSDIHNMNHVNKFKTKVSVKVKNLMKLRNAIEGNKFFK